MSGIELPGAPRQPQLVVAYPINEVSEMALKQIASDIFLALWQKDGLELDKAGEVAEVAAGLAIALNTAVNDALEERVEQIKAAQSE